MEHRAAPASPDHLTDVIGLPVVDPAGLAVGAVVGRIISGSTIDLLVRRRHLFHRSVYLRLQGAAITARGRTFVYTPPDAGAVVRLHVVQARPDGNDLKRDAS